MTQFFPVFLHVPISSNYWFPPFETAFCKAFWSLLIFPFSLLSCFLFFFFLFIIGVQHLPPPNPYIPEDLSLDASLQKHADILKEKKELNITIGKDCADSTVSGGEVQKLSSSSSTSPTKLISEDGLHVWHMLDTRFLVPKVCSYHPILSFFPYRLIRFCSIRILKKHTDYPFTVLSSR